MSDEDTEDGLYWKVAAGQPESPIGPLVAQASQGGYRLSSGVPIPVRGYYFRLLTSQGKDAAGGAKGAVTGAANSASHAGGSASGNLGADITGNASGDAQ